MLGWATALEEPREEEPPSKGGVIGMQATHRPEQGPPSEDWPQDSRGYTSPSHEMAEHCRQPWNTPVYLNPNTL